MCCGLCCKEFKGWCRSFTRTERILTVIEAALLVLLIVFLIFLILHLLACTSSEYKHKVPDKEKPDYEEVEETTEPLEVTTIQHTTKGYKPTETTSLPETNKTTSKHNTIDPNVECSWTPSAKTTSFTRYFEQTATRAKKVVPYDDVMDTKQTTTTTKRHPYTKSEYATDFIEEDQSDGEEADPSQKDHILSLVRVKPQGVVFGCMLTVISKLFLLTSASCIEAIEEVDSLDSFVIMEQYGTSSNGQSWSIVDLQIHPFYQGVNRSYDLALVRSPSPLPPRRAVALPALLDAALLTIGERLHILGFGPYRSTDSILGRRLRRAGVFLLPGAQCEGPALRHLEMGRVAGGAGGPRGGGALCAGVLFARGLPCQYCGGAPLLRAPAAPGAPSRLLGIMSDNPQCGLACEPQYYVNIAYCRDWIDSVINGQ